MDSAATHPLPSPSAWLQALPPALVQPLPALISPQALADAAHGLGQHYLHAQLPPAASPQAVLQALGNQLGFADYYAANLDALYDCLTDMQPPPTATGWVLLLSGALQPSAAPPHGASWQERFLACLEDAAQYWQDECGLAFRCFYCA